MMLDDVEPSLEALCASEPSALSDGESILELHRCLARLEAVTTRAVASFDARREWDADGARSAAAWLTGKCRLPRQAARRRVRLGRTLRHLPAAEAAWLAGEVGEAQVAALVRVRTPGTEAALAEEEEVLDPLSGAIVSDALVEMARRAGTAPADGRRPEPLFTVLVGYETLHGRICQLANGTVVSPGSLVPWLDQAWMERVVFDPASRVIDVGVSRRLFTGATRRAVQVRDQECFHPLCDEPAELCQIDHVEHRLAPLAGKTWCRLRRRSFPFRPAKPAAPATGRRRLGGDRGGGGVSASAEPSIWLSPRVFH